MKNFSAYFKFFIALVLVFTVSCASQGNKNNDAKAIPLETPKDNTKEAAKDKFPIGEVIEKVICVHDATQSYALYLPKNYTTEKKFPILFAFDAHGAGKLPVAKYKELAERYGFILVGSNNSKNGTEWEESSRIAEELFIDARNRLSINTERFYLMGFSGGARVANSITIDNGAITGVICCGASTPATSSRNPRNNYSFISIAGTKDFNYTEMKKYDMVDLAGHNVKHTLITFEGKHEWCPLETMDEAFWWLELNEMRKNVSYKNDSLIKKRFIPQQETIKRLMKQGKVYDAFNLCKKTITFYDGLADLKYCFETYKTLQTNEVIDREMKKEELIWQSEDKLKATYSQAIQSEKPEWWTKEIQTINKKIKSEKGIANKDMLERVLSYLSLVAYMQTSGALKQNALPAADYYCNLYALIDPTNSEAYYLRATIAMKTSKPEDALSALKMAVNNKFDDVTRLQNDDAFASLKNTEAFISIVKSIQKD